MAKWYQAINPVLSGTTPPTNKRFRAGTIKADASGAKFIYAPGVASLGVGDWVVFNSGTFAPTRMIAATPSTGMVGISVSANTSTTSFSWYMIYGSTPQTALSGLVRITSAGLVDKKPISQSTAGLALADGVHATLTLVGAWVIGTATGTDLGDALLDYPVAAGGSLV